MKKLCCAVISMIMISLANDATAQILDKIKNKAKQRADQKVDQTIDKGLDEAEGKNKKEKDKDKTEESAEVKNKNEEGVKSNPQGLKAYSKYDFVPGEKVIAFEDFSRAEIGDFPTRWNTNATAEVVTINNKEGKWLKIAKEGVFHPEFITNLPDNFTMEFDLAVNPEWKGTHMAVNFANLSKPTDFTNYYHYVSWRGEHAVHLQFKPGFISTYPKAHSRIIAGSTGNHTVNNDVEFKTWDNGSNNFAHISMWRQGQRLRVYVNGEKIWDIPRAFDAASKYNAVTFGMQGSYGADDYMLLGNLRLAAGAADTRNKLMTEGKWSTTGILFDVNSDKIKPTSYGTLKEIATVLSENADVKVKIIGHTDTDGDDAKNLDLSKRRAAAVKSALSKEFNIDESRLDTDGMGETKPVADNNSPEGKASNRRVEFVKM